jgi:hypothetical protein
MATVLSALATICQAADVAGTWKMTADAPDGNTYKFDLVVKDAGGKLAGTVVSPQGSIELQQVKFEGNTLTYVMPYEIGPIQMKLVLDGNTLKGSLTIPDGATGAVTGTSAAAAAGGGPVTGKWKIGAKSPDGGELKLTLEITEKEGKLAGTLSLDSGDSIPVMDLKADGPKVSFKVPTGDATYDVELTASGNDIKGTYKAVGGGQSGTITGTKG